MATDAPVIEADATEALDRLAPRLTAKAAALVAARLRSRNDENRWRRASLLWPLFAKG